jgi:uncharacterized Fe-S center protein
MPSKVYFVPFRARKSSESLPKKVTKLFESAGFSDCISKNDFVAVKTHFGESGNTTFVHPIYVRKVVDSVKACGGKPFVTDANTLYYGTRANAIEHLDTAYLHGFLPSTVGAPVIIADGLVGKDFVEIKVNLKHFKEVKLASAAVQAQALIGVSHFKGHLAAGFGGTLKNIGMGFGSRAGKQMMHSDIKPKVNRDKCIGCGTCAKWCPVQAITLTDKKAGIDQDKCYGCAECFVTCLPRAIEIRWDSSAQKLQEKMAEFVYGALKDKEGKAGFFNFVINVTPDCDCASWSDAPIVQDIGIMASKDPVAIDQASADMVVKAAPTPEHAKKIMPGKDNLQAANDIDWTHQLRYAEEIGLGSRKYEIVDI